MLDHGHESRTGPGQLTVGSRLGCSQGASVAVAPHLVSKKHTTAFFKLTHGEGGSMESYTVSCLDALVSTFPSKLCVNHTISS